jgi:hypothetical protein
VGEEGGSRGERLWHGKSDESGRVAKKTLLAVAGELVNNKQSARITDVSGK